MFQRTLKRIIDQRWTSAREIAELAGVSSSTVYRWLAGESRPEFDSVRLLVRRLPDARAQEALLSVLCAGTPWRLSHHALDLDVNHDGRIDADDALDASIAAVRSAAQSLAQVRDAGRRKALEPEAAIELIALLNQVIRQCTITQGVLVELSEHERKRKKLRLAK